MLGKKVHAGHTGLFYADLVQGITVQVEFRCNHLECNLLSDVVIEVFVEAGDESVIVLTGGAVADETVLELEEQFDEVGPRAAWPETINGKLELGIEFLYDIDHVRE